MKEKSIYEPGILKITTSLGYIQQKVYIKSTYEKDEKRKALLKYVQKKIDHIQKVLYNEYAEETHNEDRYTRRR